MKRTFILLGLAMLAIGGTGALAQDIDFKKVDKTYPYKDLPGVVEKDELTLGQPSTCTEEIRFGYNDVTRRREPMRVYTCNQGMITFESTTPPLD